MEVALGPCPDEEALVAFSVGAARSTSAVLDAHLRGCRECRTTVAALGQLSTSTGALAPIPQVPPRRDDALGRYVVLGPIGEGANGVVLEAFDPELDRRVALKILRTYGPGDGDATARLFREAQALARLQHPHVVGVLDVGVASGRPFLALELIAGQTLAAWLKGSPDWRAVLDAFLAAGRGLAAAHSAGVVHRDFKPANVLVGSSGRICVSDFGLAGPTEVGTAETDDSASMSLLDVDLTATGGLVGTPAYMAPEQLRGKPADARSDQFSFCVSLYEALFGARPFEGQTPSELLAAIDQGALKSAEGRAPRWVRHRLLQGLSAEPSQRYPSMDALLTALSRDPAQLRRRLLAGAAVAMAVASAGALGLWSASRQTARCEREADRLAGVWDASTRAQLRSAFAATGLPYAFKAAAVAEEALDGYALGWVDAASDACRSARVHGEGVLERRTMCLEGKRQDLAALVRVLVKADSQMVSRATAATQALGGLARCSDPNLLAMPALPTDPAARARFDEGRRALSDARALDEAGKYAEGLLRAVGANEAARASGYRPLLAEAQLTLGKLQERTGQFAASEASLQLAVYTAQAVRDLPTVARAATALMYTTGYRLGRRLEGHAWSRLAEASIEAAGGDDLQESDRLNHLAVLFDAEGAFEAARDHSARAAVIRERVLGPDALALALPLTNQGNALRRLGRIEEALAVDRRALAIRERSLGPRHPEVASQLTNLAVSLSGLGRTREALAAAQRALAIKEETIGPDHFELSPALNNVAVYHSDLGHPELAVPLLERALKINEKAYPEGHPKLSIAAVNLGQAYLDLGQPGRASEYFRRSLRIDEATIGPNSAEAAESMVGLGSALVALGKPEQALGLLERALRIVERGNGNELADAQFALGRALWALNQDRRRALELIDSAQRGYAAAKKQRPRSRAAVAAFLTRLGKQVGTPE